MIQHQSKGNTLTFFKRCYFDFKSLVEPPNRNTYFPYDVFLFAIVCLY